MSALEHAPTKTRLAGIDAARGVALLGMMAVHALPRSTATGAATWSFAVFGGRAAALFAVLAGVSIALITQRKRVTGGEFPAAAASLAARALVIAVIGFALEEIDPDLAMVILPYYALLFLVAIPLMVLPTSAIAWVGALTVGFGPLVTELLFPVLPDPEGENPGFGDLLERPAQLFTELTVTGAYPVLTWIAYLCVGLVIGRLALGRARIAITLVVAGVTAAAAGHVAAALLLDRYPDLDFIWSDEPHTGTTVDLTATIGSAVAVIGVLLLLSRVEARPWRWMIATVEVPLAAAGRMTLTMYALHLLFVDSDLAPDSPTTSYLVQVIAAVIIGLIWLAIGRRGPLEGLAALAARGARRLAKRLTGNRTAGASSATDAPPAPRDHAPVS